MTSKNTPERKRSPNNGRSSDPLYRTYIGMKSRCYDKNHKHYDNYGGRGIKICERWLGLEGFNNFVADMGNKPAPNNIIGRKNKNGDYEPANCFWTTPEKHGRGKHLFKNNTSGYPGVTWDSKNQKWKVVLRHNNKTAYLGRYDDLSKAIDVRRAAEAELSIN